MKAVVVHRGSRDAYQVALALAETGRLERLVTDLYFPGNRGWAGFVGKFLPALRARHCDGISPHLVRCLWASGLVSFGLDRLPGIPFSWRKRATRWTDQSLGRDAGLLASRTGAALLSYSYYGSSAFAAARPDTPRILFQLHPHPGSIRRILRKELERYPDCASSLEKEWELAMPDEEFEELAAEAKSASQWIAASSFTRATLAQNGIPAERVQVVPYGVDTQRFSPDRTRQDSRSSRALRLLFVGTLTQRKGIKYLLEALRLLPGLSLEVTICGRPVDDLAMFRNSDERIRLRPSLQGNEVLAEYRRADLFVFPSVAEGFGQVLLEAMACGVPLLSTTHTAAPDLVREGIDGFVTEPCRPDLLAQQIEWAHDHRDDLREMGEAARKRALTFTQPKFRAGLVEAMDRALSATHRREEVPAYV